MDHDDAQLILWALTEPTRPSLRKDAIGVVLDQLIDATQFAKYDVENRAEASRNLKALVAIRDELGVQVADGTDPGMWLPAVGDRIGELLAFAKYQPVVQAGAQLARFLEEPQSADELDQLQSYKAAVRTFVRDSGLAVDRG